MNCAKFEVSFNVFGFGFGVADSRSVDTGFTRGQSELSHYLPTKTCSVTNISSLYRDVTSVG